MIRLFVEPALSEGATIAPSADQTHYLTHVMRLAHGGEVALFNGRDGEWRARLRQVNRRACLLDIEIKLRDQQAGPDVELLIAVVKRTRLETIIEKAAELGAARVSLITTERTNAAHPRSDRLAAIAAEAAEQTGRLDVPVIARPARLADRLAAWPAERRLMFCDEAGDAAAAAQALGRLDGGAWAILIGPEGGFSSAERAAIRALPQTVAVSLGPRILRADTAAIAALTLWQSALGDWRGA